MSESSSRKGATFVFRASEDMRMKKQNQLFVEITNKVNMQNILSLSILSIQNENAGQPNILRAMLWNGRLSAVPLEQVGELKNWTSSAQNFFRALEELQRDACVFADETGLQIKGINIGVKLPCWPVEEKNTWRYSQRPPYGMYEIDQILNASQEQGLALAPIPETVGSAKPRTMWVATLYPLLPEIPLNEIEKRAYLLCVKNPNIFEAARELKLGAEQRETERGNKILVGVHDDYGCWPKGL